MNCSDNFIMEARGSVQKLLLNPIDTRSAVAYIPIDHSNFL